MARKHYEAWRFIRITSIVIETRKLARNELTSPTLVTLLVTTLVFLQCTPPLASEARCAMVLQYLLRYSCKAEEAEYTCSLPWTLADARKPLHVFHSTTKTHHIHIIYKE